MITVTLYGTPSCRRYQRMRDLVTTEANRLSIAIQVIEIGDTESLSKINPLSLPRLYLNDELFSSQNPPSAASVTAALQKILTSP